MVTPISITEFIEHHQHALVIDVRSPAEYEYAHIPGAKNLPLFSNEERKTVGTLYKQQSRFDAIKRGVDFFGPKMHGFLEEVERWYAKAHPSKASDAKANWLQQHAIVVHCWRGGMRSAAVAWLLDLYGFKVHTIQGGYKSFRRWCRQRLEPDYPFVVVGGFTGSGKTDTLYEMQKQGEAVLDLEALASHKGSAFGNINMPPQPSQEMFENRLSLALHGLTQPLAAQPNAKKVIWVEDESQRIGDINIPFEFYKKVRKAPVLLLDIPFEERLQHIVKDYGKGEIERLVNATIRIQKRLGGLEAKNVIGFLMDGDLTNAFSLLLRYYDKWYGKAADRHRDNANELIHVLPSATTNAVHNANLLLESLPTIQQ